MKACGRCRLKLTEREQRKAVNREWEATICNTCEARLAVFDKSLETGAEEAA